MLSVTMSIGVAVFPDEAINEDDLVNAANSALYRAKQNGRNRVMCACDGERMRG